MKKNNYFVVAAVIFLVTLACRSVLVEEATVTPIALPRTATPPRPTQVISKIYNVGDVAEMHGYYIVLNSVEIDSKGLLTANFTVDNQSSEEFFFRGLKLFTAKDNEGVVLPQNQLDCSAHYLDNLSPGEKVKGDLCWDVTSSPPFTIYYEDPHGLFDPIVWSVSP